MSFNSFLLFTNYGKFEITSDTNNELDIHSAIKELQAELSSSKAKEFFINDDELIYAVEIGFYYGSKYVELDEPIENKEQALVLAIEHLENYLEILNEM